MDRPRFILNPNAAPFIPNFKRAFELHLKEENMGAKETFCNSATYDKADVHEAFDSTSQHSSNITENLVISDEDSRGICYEVPEPDDDVHQYETLGFVKEDLEDSFQVASEYLSYLFPNFSLESVNEVYRACSNVAEAKLMLEQLEGDDDGSHNLPSDFGGASSSGHNGISSDLLSQPDSEAVQQVNSTNMDSA